MGVCKMSFTKFLKFSKTVVIKKKVKNTEGGTFFQNNCNFPNRMTIQYFFYFQTSKNAINRY